MNTYFPPELQKKKALSESLPSRKVHLLQPSDTCRLSFDYSDFVSIIHALNAAGMKFDAPVYIFFIFPENNLL